MKASSYYRLDIVMKTGFKYSTVSNGRMLEGLKKSSSGYWTESVEVVEITEEEYRAYWGEEVVSEEPIKKKRKSKVPKFANIEDFLK